MTAKLRVKQFSIQLHAWPEDRLFGCVVSVKPLSTKKVQHIFIEGGHESDKDYRERSPKSINRAILLSLAELGELGEIKIGDWLFDNQNAFRVVHLPPLKRVEKHKKNGVFSVAKGRSRHFVTVCGHRFPVQGRPLLELVSRNRIPQDIRAEAGHLGFLRELWGVGVRLDKTTSFGYLSEEPVIVYEKGGWNTILGVFREQDIKSISGALKTGKKVKVYRVWGQTKFDFEIAK